ncbi:MAG TPA: lytic transglycosylase domain-containing protein [Solirubrobacteraceae bacterium]|jgi:soluble lytic murein transglycosylase-like protein|nr:lytic transglycosylase domain-containing protein [Solirubrobacteraceae bacterium]
MNTAIAPTVGIPEDEQAIAQRVQQLQGLIQQTRQVGSGIAPTSATAGASTTASQVPAGDFAAALQAATAADVSSPTATQSESVAGAAGAGGEYDSMIEQAAERYGVDPAVLHGLIQQESGFDPGAQSSAGASGLTQLMPGTASSMGVANPLNPTESIEGGARYLSQLMSQFGGNTEDALAAYNAGPGAVQQYGGIPPYAETQSYVSKVLGYTEAYRQTHPTSISAGGLA